MDKLTLDLFIEYNSNERLLTTLASILVFKTFSDQIILPTIHILVKIDAPMDLVPIKQLLSDYDIPVDIIGYFEPSHQVLAKKCNSKYVAFMSDGDNYDVKFFNVLNDTVYNEKKPILFAKNDKVVCSSLFMYDSFCLEENPMQQIFEACSYSKPHLVLDLGTQVATT